MNLASPEVLMSRFHAGSRYRFSGAMNTYGDIALQSGPGRGSARTVISVVVASGGSREELPATGATWLAEIRTPAAAVLRVRFQHADVAGLRSVPVPSMIDRALEQADDRLHSASTAGEVFDQVQRALGVSSGDVQRALQVGRTTAHLWKQKKLEQVRESNRQRLREVLAAALLWQEIGEGRSVAPLYRARIGGRTLQGLLSDVSLSPKDIENHLRRLPAEFVQLSQAQARQRARLARGFDPFEGQIDP